MVYRFIDDNKAEYGLNLHSVVLKKKPRYYKGEQNKIFPNLLKQNFNVEEKTKYGVQILHILDLVMAK